MPRWIEGLAERRIAGDTGALQHLQKLAMDQLDAAHDTRGVVRGARCAEGAVEVVEHREKVAQQRLVRVPDVLLAVPLTAPPDVCAATPLRLEIAPLTAPHP